MKTKERVFLPERPADFGPQSAPLAAAKFFWDLICQADEAGIRLEVVRGLTVWEAAPGYAHQVAIDRIRSSIACTLASSSPCNCVNVAGVVTVFADGSLKRPDIAIYR